MAYTLESEEQDKIVLLDSVPVPSPGSTEPFVIANERQVAIVYRIAEIDFERYGPFSDEDEPFCLVQFPWAAFHRLGPPNDEGLGSHPLAAVGLKWYQAHEVLKSSFVASSWKRVSPHHPRRHFVFTFQDSTFECVAADCVMSGVYGSADIAGREAFSLFR
ncbi:hypothetical protein FAZ95_25210 [Trinickia violacea]|uniref:Uncharacterized protein n=1 Tax=Trinickia violacea TaxID=2571746 RepID=A0A4P8IVK3_9BURK|nr:hypothetical protein [Trinickia violacea]QCP52471.1 hypothetical protein FAZ95_25210 [Trinickia violacea]